MAKYIGSLTSDARGRIGGFVTTRARNGTNLKAHSVGVNPRSVYQTTLRQRFASAIAAWRILSDANRQTWALLAPQYTYFNSLAQPYSPTGLQLWQQAFVNAANAGAVPPSAAPVSPPFVDVPIQMYMARSGGSLTWTADAAGGAWNGSATLSASFILPPTVNYAKGIRRRPMGYQPGGSSIACATNWILAYGPLPSPGDNLALRCVPFDSVHYISGTPFSQIVTVS